MSTEMLDRQDVLDLLMGEWAGYVAQFQSLSPAAQAAFLQDQGYQKLADLLAHIVAWWDAGMRSIQRYLTDPVAAQLEVDVDGFNARAVENAAGVSQEGVIRAFEESRLKFIEVVQALSDRDFKDGRVQNQIRMELVNHLQDHRIQ
jgi:hypothetical protein